jgi:DNA repair protein RadC
MHTRVDSHVPALGRYQVRELVCTYRPARDGDGHVIRVPSLALSTAREAVRVLGPFIADHTVEIVGVACLSTRHRLLAWHIASRGTRDATPISIPDVFVPACVTPGTTAVIVVHNHPSGDPAPSQDDVILTARLRVAGDVLEIALLDHLIVGEESRYFSFREAGLLGRTPAAAPRPTVVRHLSADDSHPPTAAPPSAAPIP